MHDSNEIPIYDQQTPRAGKKRKRKSHILTKAALTVIEEELRRIRASKSKSKILPTEIIEHFLKTEGFDVPKRVKDAARISITRYVRMFLYYNIGLILILSTSK